MMYLGQNAVGIATKIPVGEIYQNTIVAQENNSQTIIFNDVEKKPDAFIIGVMNISSTVPSGYYGCTTACGIWSEYQGGQYVGGRATGIDQNNSEDHWQITASNITYDADAKTFTIFTNSPVRFISGWTYKLSYYISHRGGDT